MNLRSVIASAILLASTANAADTPLHGSADFLPTTESPSNFRGDPRGGYPGATIPSDFSAEKNLAWKAEPGQGCGTVVVVGKRLFVQAAPNALVCLDTATGKELWRRTHHADTLDPKSQDAVFDGLMDSLGEYHRLAQKMNKMPQGERSEIQAAMDKIILGMPAPWNTVGKGDPAIAYQIPGAGIGGYGYGGIYLICTTPASDGQRVVARFPTGIVVAYDLDGKHLWSAGTRLNIPRPESLNGKSGEWPPKPSQSACPLLTPEGIVVVSTRNLVFGLDAATGKERWRVLDPNIHNTYASPVLGRIGNENFVAIGDGTIVRARDGFLVHTDVKGTSAPTCPVFADGVFYWVTHAVRVVAGNPPRAEVVWDWTLEQLKAVSGWFPYRIPRLSSDLDMASPVLVDGKIIYYGASMQRKMAVIDAKTGTVLSQAPYQRPKFNLPGGLGKGVTKNWPYSGMTRMGDRLMVAHDNGLVYVYPINDTFSPAVACGVPDDLYAHPVAHGSRLYLRSLNALWCFEEKPGQTNDKVP